jgi:hypothetical protein
MRRGSLRGRKSPTAGMGAGPAPDATLALTLVSGPLTASLAAFELAPLNMLRLDVAR